VSVTELNLLEWPPLRGQCSWPLAHIRARAATNGIPTGHRHYFGRVEPCLRDDHTFRFDLRFGSFNDWSRLGLIESQQSAVFYIPYSRQPDVPHSKLGNRIGESQRDSLNWPLDAAPLSLPHPLPLMSDFDPEEAREIIAASSTASFQPNGFRSLHG